MNQYAFFFMLSFLFLFGSRSIAQYQLSDSTFYEESVQYLTQDYFSQIGESALLYNGSQYIRNGQKASGFPFFLSDSLLAGSVSYHDGICYRDLSLYYDLVSDELITNNFTHNALIRLVKQKVDSFSISGHYFLRLETAKTNGEIKSDGFYEVLNRMQPELYVKREKKMEIPSGYGDPKYVQYNKYYLKINNRFYSFESKNSFLDLLKDQKSSLKSFIRFNKLNFKKRFEEAIVQTINHYSQLKR